jgi:signal transduction histidine kinase
VDIHDGTVALESHEGVGTRFEVRLPVGSPPPQSRAVRQSPLAADS